MNLLIISFGAIGFCTGIVIGIEFQKAISIPVEWILEHAKANKSTTFYADNEIFEKVDILGNACETVLVNWIHYKQVRKWWRR